MANETTHDSHEPAKTPDQLVKPEGDNPMSAKELDQVSGGQMIMPPGKKVPEAWKVGFK